MSCEKENHFFQLDVSEMMVSDIVIVVITLFYIPLILNSKTVDHEWPT